MAFPNYTENVPLMSDNVWQSNPEFTYSLLSGVYKIAEKNLKQIFPNFNEISGCKINPDDLLDFQYCENVDADEIIDDFSGVFSYIVIWLIFGLIFTIVGIIWCFCNKCCCCCGVGKENKIKDLVNTDPEFEIAGVNTSKSDEPAWNTLGLRIFVGVLMALWIIGFAFSVFTAFASNESLRRSIFEFRDDVDKPLHDTEMYLNTTKNQINAVFITSYGNLSDRIMEIAESTKASSQHNNLARVHKLLETTEIFLSTFQTHEKSMDENLSLQLNGISSHLKELKLSLEFELRPLLYKIDENTRQTDSSIEDGIRISGEQLQRNANDQIAAIDEIPLEEVRNDIEETDEDILDIVGASIYGTFMTFNVVILALLTGVIMGFVVTWIGKGAAKKTGFIFYRFTIATMFTVGWFIILAMISGFIGAGFFGQIACETVRDLEVNYSTDANMGKIDMPIPTQSSLLDVFQAQESSKYDVPSYGHVVRSCKAGASAFNALKLEQVFDVESIYNISDIIIAGLILKRDSIDNFFIKNVQSVYASLDVKLIVLQKSPFPDLKSESQVIVSELKTIYSQIDNQLSSLLENIKVLESEDMLRNSINQIIPIEGLVNNYETFVHEQVTDSIGQCEPLYIALNATVHIFCYKVLAPVATYWWSLQLLLVMFVAVIITALAGERLLR